MKKIELSPNTKKALEITLMAVQIAVVIIAIIISAIVIANPIVSSGEVSEGKTKLLPVLTDSMNGDQKDSFKKGDLVIAKTPKDVFALEVGDIVTFQYREPSTGITILNTHRIIEVVRGADGKALTYVTHGDANPVGSNENVNPNTVLAVYSSHLKGIGGAITWLQDPTNFLLVIVLPLAILFIYNIVQFVRMIVMAKMAKVKEESAVTANLDEEEIKRRAIEEYLASKNNNEENTEE